MSTKIAFFDIDGTLLDFGATDMTEKTYQALDALRSHGVKLFLATGRPTYFLPEFAEKIFDGALCFNGSYCYDRETLIYKNPIALQDMKTVIVNAKNLGLPVTIANSSRMGSNFFNEDLEEYMQISHHTCAVTSDFDRLMDEDVYQLMVPTTEAQDTLVLRGTTTLKSERWWERAMDVIPADSGKSAGIEKILAYYGIRREETMAFGDGGNDVDMIRFAGIGVAMGNAGEEAKAAADYVTDGCAEDGIYTAVKHFGYI